jgi:hypothetical protein
MAAAGPSHKVQGALGKLDAGARDLNGICDPRSDIGCRISGTEGHAFSLGEPN